MQTYTMSELLTFCQWADRILVGSRLQEVFTSDDRLVLGFFKSGMKWLILDFQKKAPLAVLFENSCPLRKGKTQKPVVHFLKAHAMDGLYSSFSVKPGFGRVLELVVQRSTGNVLMEFQMIPHQANLIIQSGEKSISWAKPVPLSPPPDYTEPVGRETVEIRRQWEESLGATKLEAKSENGNSEQSMKRAIAKKKKAIEAIEVGLLDEKWLKWRTFGELLKSMELSQVGADWDGFVDRAQSRSWNMENAFAKSKLLAAKTAGAKKRIEILHKEISDLESGQVQAKLESKKATDLFQGAEARGRKFTTESGLTAYVGKSGKDNLALLRKAKSWDIWMHLRDYPGAHLILHMPKGHRLTDKELLDTAQWFIHESLRNKQKIGQFEVLLTECRFVRPIKGDKLGRVNYQNERTILVKI